jgi:Tol biopolymer transport system component
MIYKNKIYIIIFCVLMVGSFFLVSFISKQGKPQGRIIYRERLTSPNIVRIMDADGGNIRALTKSFGPAVPSRDIKKLAVIGCYSAGTPINYDEQTICIYRLSNDYIYGGFKKPKMIMAIALPEECQGRNIESGFSEVRSMSWSNDGKSLLLVCGGETSQSLSDVCVLDIAGEYQCWDKKDAADVKHADWSPIDDMVVVIKGYRENSKIYLTDPDGKSQRYLEDGWAAEWSSDGNRIAYIRYQNMDEQATHDQMGIATIDKDGSSMKWLFLTNFGWESYKYLFLDWCDEEFIDSSCQLDWSPDDSFLVFTSAYMGESVNLFLIDIKSGEIAALNSYARDPEWVE